MKKSTFFILGLFLLLELSIFAQDYNIQPKHGIELQSGANAPVACLKYQHYFWLNPRQHFMASAGVGLFYGINFNQDFTYSIGDGRNFWEFGVLGLYSNVISTNDRKDYQYLVLPMMGYKYISPKWFSARLNFAPYSNKGRLYPYGGISISFLFKQKNYIETNPNINTVRFTKE